jgi:hypothetical protein
MTVQRPPFRRGGSSGRNPQGCGRGRGDGNNAHRPQRQPPTKFRGNCTELQGCIFDCKRKSLLDDNIQKTCSLVIGQCTDLIQSKLKQQAAWATISSDQDAIALIGLIKTITFRFEDQKFLPLALYLSKASLYNL